MKTLKYALQDLWQSKVYTLLLLLLFTILSWVLLVCFTVRAVAVQLNSLGQQIGSLLAGGLSGRFSGPMSGFIANLAPASMIIIIAAEVVAAALLSLLLVRHMKAGKQETKNRLAKGRENAKIKTMAQYLSGVLIVAAVSFGIAVFSGYAILHGVENTLMQKALSSMQNKSLTDGDNVLESRIEDALLNRLNDNTSEKGLSGIPGMGRLGGLSAANTAKSAGALMIVILLGSIPLTLNYRAQ